MTNIEEEERIEYVELEFDLEGEAIKDHAIMFAKKYKILNSKLETIP